MSDAPDRRKRPRHQTPVEILRRIADALERLQAEATDSELDEAADAVGEALDRIQADIKRRLV